MLMFNFSKNMGILMEAECLTQAELAEAIGVSQSIISAWLLGQREPSGKNLCLLADYFNVTIDQLVGREKLFN